MKHVRPHRALLLLQLTQLSAVDPIGGVAGRADLKQDLREVAKVVRRIEGEPAGFLVVLG